MSASSSPRSTSSHASSYASSTLSSLMPAPTSAFVPGDEFGEPMLLFGEGVGEVMFVSSEQPFGKITQMINGKGSWHSQSLQRDKRRPARGAEEAVIDFGGAGDEIYDLCYMWLRNDHSSSYSLEYKNIEGEWVLLVDWTDVEPYEFITLSDIHVPAAELKLKIKGCRIWDASWVSAKVYGRIDPVTNFIRALAKCMLARDDLDELRHLIKEGGTLNLQEREEMKEAMSLRDFLHLRQECKFATEQRDLHFLEEVTKEAIEKKMEGDITVMMAVETLSQLVAERDYKFNHPAYKFMRKHDIDEASASKYLGFFAQTGYDCLVGLACLRTQDEDGQYALAKLRDIGVRSAVHRERIMKGLSHVKLPKLNQSHLLSFLVSLNISERDVKRYINMLWTIKYDTTYDLFETDRAMLEKLEFKDGHIDAIMLVSEGGHSKFASVHGDDE